MATCCNSRIAFIVALALALMGAGTASHTAAADDGQPRIAAVEVGLANTYKVGYWLPVRVTVDNASSLAEARIAVTVADSDGVATKVTAPLWPVSGDDPVTTTLYTKVGRVGSPISVALEGGGRAIDRTAVRPGAASHRDNNVVDLPATAELLVSLGNVSPGVREAFGERDDARGNPSRRAIGLQAVGDLPDEWFGYESVDILVLDGRETDLLRDLAANETLYAALVRWIELGGRLVFSCGGEAAEKLLGDDGPLAALVPGRYVESVRLPETGPLEHFAKSEAVADRGRGEPIEVPRLLDVTGSIEVYAGRRPTDLPLLVRSPRGLGEICFVGIDFEKPPLNDWPGRKPFLEAVLRPYVEQDNEVNESQSLVARGYNDLSGALRQRMGRSFTGVAPITFPIVAVLAVAYLLALGPGDYLLVRRWFKRPLVAWVTFPIIVVGFGAVAFALAEWRKTGGEARINERELVDIDVASGTVRGTYWGTLYSARAELFNLALDVRRLRAGSGIIGDDRGQGEAALPGGGAPSPRPSPEGRGSEPTEADVLLSWWGLPGVGVGGMQAGGSDLGIVQRSYAYGPKLASLLGVPVLESSTKSLMARWTASAVGLVEAQIVDQDGLAAGVIQNRTDVEFRNVKLFYNGWAFRLGNLAAGERIDVGDDISPRRVKTIVTQEALGPTTPGLVEGQAFVAQRATAGQILRLMMFYEAAGGQAFAQLPNDYQSYCDLSRLLDLGRAMLVAEVSSGGSQLVGANGDAIADVKRSDAPVLYRFVLPVDDNESAP